jgi:hypothetical protein
MGQVVAVSLLDGVISFISRMRHNIANWLNERGRTASDAGRKKLALRFYHVATFIEPSWSVPWYNAGLVLKYQGRWAESLWMNQRAALLDPSDEAAWWNLAIAATALRNWSEAARAWKACGIAVLQDAGGEVATDPATACVRLNPNSSGEVVWGERIDPVRFLVLNVPLPESKHRFKDVILNDGAQNGERESRGRKFPVFDELALWQKSDFSTFKANITIPNESSEVDLIELCRSAGMGVEDWGTIRMLCAECSRGNPGPHTCESSEQSAEKSFAFAARSETELRSILDSWAANIEDADYDDIALALAADA